MTITYIKGEVPTFLFNTSDLIGGDHFTGSQSYIGAPAYNLDTGLWFIVKSDGTLASYTVPISVSGALTLASLPAGSNLIGSVTTIPSRNLAGQPTTAIAMTVAATYVTGDFVGTSAAPISFASCSAVAGSGGYIMGATLIDYAKQSVAGELWLFDRTVTPPTDSAAWTLSDADMAKLVCVIPFSTYYASALNSVSMGKPDLAPARFVCGAAVQTLFGCFVTRGSPVYASGDLVVRLSLVQD